MSPPQGTQRQVVKKRHCAQKRKHIREPQTRSLPSSSRVQNAGVKPSDWEDGRYLDGDEYDVHGYPDESRGPQNEKGVHRANNHEDGDGGWQGTKQGSFKQGIAIT